MDDKALISLLKDLLEYKKKEARYLFIALVCAIVINLLVVGSFLYYESQMETVVTTTTEQEVSGDESNIVNGDQVQGDQYNDGSK